MSDDDATRVDLLKTSYGEVLDATKHQDDKIGRLLTAIAFLTAASLALANLTARDTLVRHFYVTTARRTQEQLPPLVLIALATFLICIIFSVVLLVGSLTTPLKIPGLGVSGKSRTTRPTSQIYFYPIVARGEAAWRAKWSGDVEGLRAERLDMYVDETYNLAIRTDFKYARTNEAVAVFSFGLLAFAATSILALVAAAAPCHPAPAGGCAGGAELDLVLRCALAALVGLYTLVQLLGQLRYAHMAADDSRNVVGEVHDLEWRKAFAQRCFVTAASLAAALPLPTVFARGSAQAEVLFWLDVVALVVAAALYAQATYRHPESPRGRSERERHYTFAAVVAGLAASLAVVCLARVSGEYALQLLAGAIVPAGITLAALLGPTGHAAERRARVRARQSGDRQSG